MLLKSIDITKFKRFDVKDPVIVPLASNVTALVGPNSCGKTTVLQTLPIVSFVDKSQRDVSGNLLTGRHGTDTINKPIEDILKDSIDSAVPQNQTTAAVGLTFSNGSTFSVEFKESELNIQVSSGVPRFRAIYVPRGLTFPRGTDERKLNDDELNERSVVADGYLTSHHVLFLKKKGHLDELQQLITSIFPHVGTLHVVELKKTVRLSFGDQRTPWVQEGSGVCTVLCTLAAILYDKHERFASAADITTPYCRVIALDEPTSALHPQLFARFMTALTSLDAQVLIATHSVDYLLLSMRSLESDNHLVSFYQSPPIASRGLSDEMHADPELSLEDIRVALPHQPKITASLASASDIK